MYRRPVISIYAPSKDTDPLRWRHIDPNGALFAQSAVGKVTVPRISLLLHRC